MSYPPAPTPIPAYLFARAVVWTGAAEIAVETSPAIAIAYDGSEILGVSGYVQTPSDTGDIDFEVEVDGSGLGPFAIPEDANYMSEAVAGAGAYEAGDTIVFDVTSIGANAVGPVILAVYFRLSGVTFEA